MGGCRRCAWIGLLLGACGDPHSVVSGRVTLDPNVFRMGYSTLEIRVVEHHDDEVDARARPSAPTPFMTTLELEGLEFPYDYELVEDAFYEWDVGWAVAWLSQRGAPEPEDWVLASEPFGATRIELVVPGKHLAPTAEGADVLVLEPE
ncbi:MAG TPA: hypothetical protein VG755_06610 [Nannocystaceae bacterium]|nr:hypothetical protein [Nannocystaceae bacterium]